MGSLFYVELAKNLVEGTKGKENEVSLPEKKMRCMFIIDIHRGLIKSCFAVFQILVPFKDYVGVGLT